MTPDKLADQYLSTARSRSAKIESDVILILSALLLIWSSIEVPFTSLKKEVQKYNGIKLAKENTQKLIKKFSEDKTYTLTTIDSLKSLKTDDATAENRALHLSKSDKLNAIEAKIGNLLSTKEFLDNKKLEAQKDIKLKLPFVGEINCPYFLTTLIWCILEVAFLIYLYYSRKKIMKYNYSSIKYYQDKIDSVKLKDLGISIPFWFSPLPKSGSLTNEIILKSVDWDSMNGKTKIFSSVFLLLLLVGINARMLYISVWIKQSMNYMPIYWLIIIGNILTLIFSIYIAIAWYAFYKIEIVEINEIKEPHD